MAVISPAGHIFVLKDAERPLPQATAKRPHSSGLCGVGLGAGTRCGVRGSVRRGCRGGCWLGCADAVTGLSLIHI